MVEFVLKRLFAYAKASRELKAEWPLKERIRQLEIMIKDICQSILRPAAIESTASRILREFNPREDYVANDEDEEEPRKPYLKNEYKQEKEE